jgi:hypothetical protein
MHLIWMTAEKEALFLAYLVAILPHSPVDGVVFLWWDDSMHAFILCLLKDGMAVIAAIC